ncbi:carboxypeptidase-like regulatory domain-containing protein [Litoribacter ruber]|uniref:Carboxypeptidase-like regulatory domain-containing protein n=1 Tax=Litoribacter ruber TaxID=702568 RepID=A0AAP2CM10_9BACT|nr:MULTISPECIES: carboxypeptidase-like regulatory domain-containing protein [Litoribacter]MBS9524352.1 carboxypeptidase-like regulatory domain-containing protein [Litoribacter alkaliphilus]MBT0809848.1 carboxypeptidase-like regulatory domain-containing protein [Litoribacter ruber]
MKYINYLCLLAISFSFLGCELENIDIDRFGTITGVVVDGESYEPLSGVQITTTPASTSVLTDEEGTFQLNKVRYGDVVINARKKDFLSGTINIAVYEEENTNLTFFLLEDDRDVGNVVIYDPVPGNGAVDQPLSFTFQWNVDQDNRDRELEYTVYIFQSNSTTQTIVGENLTTTEVVVADLQPATTYFWYVVAKHDGRNVANSPTWTFRTGNP